VRATKGADALHSVNPSQGDSSPTHDTPTI
jgi:hypothetical protein